MSRGAVDIGVGTRVCLAQVDFDRGHCGAKPGATLEEGGCDGPKAQARDCRTFRSRDQRNGLAPGGGGRGSPPPDLPLVTPGLTIVKHFR